MGIIEYINFNKLIQAIKGIYTTKPIQKDFTITYTNELASCHHICALKRVHDDEHVHENSQYI
jgi:predicted metal-binding protein